MNSSTKRCMPMPISRPPKRISRRAAQVLAAARGLYYPSTEVATGGVRGRDATTDEILEFTGQQPKTIWLVEDVFKVAYEVDLFGRVRRAVEAVRANARSRRRRTRQFKNHRRRRDCPRLRGRLRTR